MSRFWKVVELEYLQKNYADSTSHEIASHLNRPICSVYNKAYFLGLKKSDAFYKSDKSGRLTGVLGSKTRFTKGSTPWNKGVSHPSTGRTKETQFKKGNRPHNYNPIGTTRFSKDGYLEMKITDPNKWAFVHRLEYEKHFGSVPENSIVVFKNGDKTDISKENLEAITRNEAICRMHKGKEYLAFLLERDPDQRTFLLNNYPKLIYIKQLQLELNKQIRSHE